MTELVTVHGWRILDARTKRWRVLRWKMTEKDAQEWAKKEGVQIERVDGSGETRNDVDGRYR